MLFAPAGTGERDAPGDGAAFALLPSRTTPAATTPIKDVRKDTVPLAGAGDRREMPIR
ncbi:hypothetical protein ACFQHO_25350 [Actinomadura yumaensis]|uniref:hypothetical protein n=1 Tax=Actinomadura yumaensis TaxID=111807 RepID=UPI003608EA9F